MTTLPASDPVTVRTLSGLSGAAVKVLSRDGKHWFVRKRAADRAKSDRLRRQAAKQEWFASNLRGVLKTPRILASGDIEGCFYYDMEFVRGLDAATYLRQATYQNVSAFAGRLTEYLDAIASAPAFGDEGGLSFFESSFAKVCSVQERTSALSEAALAQLFVGLERIRRLGTAKATACHGDLTLENILVTESGEFYVLDLLDAPFEHYWQDVAKLYQDLAGGWYLLTQPPVAQCVLDHVGRRLFDRASLLDPSYPDVHPVLVALTFVRILPYVQSPEQRRFVQERVEHFTSLIEPMRTSASRSNSK